MPDRSLSDPPRLLVLSLPSLQPEAGVQTEVEAPLTGLPGGLLDGMPAGTWRRVADPATAAATLAETPGARLMLLCPRPEIWVALSLAEGTPPTQAVQEWRLAQQSLMGVLRAWRRRVVLVFTQTLAADPAACLAALGLDLPDMRLPETSDPESLPAPDPADDPVLAMIAREALRRDPAAQALAEELVASALAPERAGTLPDAAPPEAVFATYTALMRGLETAEHSASAAGSRVAELEVRLADLVGQIDAAATHRAGLETALGAERDRASSAEARQAETEAARATLQAECETLTAGLAEAKRDAEARLAQAKRDAEAARAAAETAAMTVQAALEAEAALLRDQTRLDAALLAQLQDQLGTERDRASSAEARQTEAEAARATLQAKCETLTTGLAEAKRDAEARLAKAKTDAAAKRAAAEAKAKTAQAALEAEAALLRDQIRLDAALLAGMQDRLGAEQDRSKAAEAHVAALLAERAALAERLSTTEREGRDRLSRATEDQEQMIRQLRAQIHQMGQGLESYHAQVESLEAERSDLLEQLRQMQDTREDLEGYYDRARQFSEQVEGLTADLQRAQDLLAERDRHLEWLQDEIGRIHRSRSYRLTAPLRKMRKIVG